jgi:hypothetical protein
MSMIVTAGFLRASRHTRIKPAFSRTARAVYFAFRFTEKRFNTALVNRTTFDRPGLEPKGEGDG